MPQIITAAEGKVFRRLHDGFVMGKSIHLGVDHSTGEALEDLPEYYDEISEIIDTINGSSDFQ